jgi:hypothetical protein
MAAIKSVRVRALPARVGQGSVHSNNRPVDYFPHVAVHCASPCLLNTTRRRNNNSHNYVAPIQPSLARIPLKCWAPVRWRIPSAVGTAEGGILPAGTAQREGRDAFEAHFICADTHLFARASHVVLNVQADDPPRRFSC